MEQQKMNTWEILCAAVRAMAKRSDCIDEVKRIAALIDEVQQVQQVNEVQQEAAASDCPPD